MLRIIGETNPGKVRHMNQDAFAYRVIGEQAGYAIVCDGMGGENAGDVASTTACQMISGYFARDLSEDMGELSVKAVIFSAVSAANAKVYAMAKSHREYNGMGTTLVLAVLMGTMLHLVNIGDSRLYVISGKQATQLTKDHTIVQTMVDRGELTIEQAQVHPRRHLITRAIGVGDTLDIDYQVFDVKPTDRILLCTDGLTNYAGLEKLPELVQKSVSEKNTKYLVDYANNHGGSDNVTAVVLYQV